MANERLEISQDIIKGSLLSNMVGHLGDFDILKVEPDPNNPDKNLVYVEVDLKLNGKDVSIRPWLEALEKNLHVCIEKAARALFDAKLTEIESAFYDSRSAIEKAFDKAFPLTNPPEYT